MTVKFDPYTYAVINGVWGESTPDSQELFETKVLDRYSDDVVQSALFWIVKNEKDKTKRNALIWLTLASFKKKTKPNYSNLKKYMKKDYSPKSSIKAPTVMDLPQMQPSKNISSGIAEQHYSTIIKQNAEINEKLDTMIALLKDSKD